MSFSTNPADLLLAHRLADAAGDAIRPLFRARFAVEHKADASPVTEADRAAEAAMRAILDAERPDDGVIGEEYGEKPGRSGRRWVLDPIDGTQSFVAGRPIFGTLIALLEGDRPVLGVVDQPIARERWSAAAGRPTELNGAGVAARTGRGLTQALLASTSPRFFGAADLKGFARIERASRQATVFGGDCYNYALLASGHLDLVVEAGLKLHDFAALVPVVEGAGGAMADWNGRPLHAGSDGRVIAAGSRALLDEAVALLRSG